ncbi:MAG: copper amine oxidase N-terminal domain-containing protein [Clostridiales bacterium]|nr:copper amine oxidase N-terminal domain-containing protein [Clostridiales bacterium]
MKKFLSFLLAGTMLLSSQSLVFAEDETVEVFTCDFDETTTGLEYYLTIKEISGGNVTFFVEYIGYNFNYFYTTEDITAPLNGNTAEFTWTDSWFNSGKGTLVINNGSVNLKMEETETSDFNRSSMDTTGRSSDSSGSVTLSSMENTGAAYSLISSSQSQQEQTAQASQTIGIYLNGEALSFPQEPYIEDGTTMVPMRAIFEALGAEVLWDGALRTIDASKDGTNIVLTIDSTTAYINGEASELAKAPVIVEGSTMVPLRFVSEALGCEVSYEAETKSIYING